MAYASGDVVNVSCNKQDFRTVEFPNTDSLLAGAYNLVLVKGSDGSLTFRFIAPISDATLSAISTLTVKGGIITAKA